MKIRLMKVPQGLVAYDEESAQIIKKWPVATFILAEAVRPRNYEHHKKMFALLEIVLKNTDHFESIDETLEYFKIKTGQYKIMKVGDKYYPITKSISFGSMSQDEFNLFYDKAIQVALDLLRIDQEELAQQIAQF